MAIRIIGGALRGRHLRVPPGRAVRPTTDRVRESLFNILGERVRDRVVYDLFAGSGALGIEALSRGARRAVFVERHRRGAALIRRNLGELGIAAQATVILSDASAWLHRMEERPEAPALVLLDPPYEQLRRAPQQLVELLGELRQRFPAGTIVVVEHDGGFNLAVHGIAGTWETRVYGQTRLSLSVFDDDTGVMEKSPEPDRRSEVNATPREQFAREVVGRLVAAGFRALWAGGCVRDMLLGRSPEDYDVATEAHPEQVREVFGRRRTVAVGAAFGVVEVLGPRRAGTVQVATFRSDLSYSDGRHPDRVEFGTAQADAQRRDFTINGMFYDPLKEEVLDYVEGQQDLKAGVVRAIGNPPERFTDDKLRLMRAVRFAANLGFTIEPRTREAIRRLAPEIHVVSAERVAEELRRMLLHPSRSTAMQMAFDLRLIEAVLPELLPTKHLPQHKPMQPEGDLWDHTLLVLEKLDESWEAINAQRMGRSPSPALPFPLAFAALLHDAGKPATVRHGKGKLTFHNHEHKGREIAEAICRRLKLSNDETARTCWLVEHHMYLGQSRQLRWSKMKRMLVEPEIIPLLALHWADALASTGDTSSIAYCLDVLRNMPGEQLNPPALLTGHDLIRRGVAKGPIYRKILEAVRDAQLENEVRSKREALALVDELVQQYEAE